MNAIRIALTAKAFDSASLKELPCLLIFIDFG